MGTDDTTLIERMEPSSFVAAGDRLLVLLNSSRSTACPGDTRTTPKGSNVLVEEPEQVESGTTSQKGKPENLSWKPGSISEVSGSGE